MKKNFATYLAMFTLLFLSASCVSSDDDEVVLSPYALVTSFGVNNIKSSYHSFTATGEDTIVVRTIATAGYPFSIDQSTGEIYNNDSLPFGTDVSKVVIKMSVKGVASIYVDSTETYEAFSFSDSIDFTTPRKFRIYAADAQYYKDYTVSVNVHTLNPDLLQWNKYPAVEGITPQRVVEFNGNICLFGIDGAGVQVVAMSPLAGEPVWEQQPVAGLPAASLENIQQFCGKLYAVAGGDLYSSADALNWSLASAGGDYLSIVSASDFENRMWVATATGLLSSCDGTAFDSISPLPASFPLYGLSLASYPLSHNSKIIRNMLVGYRNAEMTGAPVVWSKLSSEENWVMYNNGNNPYPCPALKNLSVLHYDNFLYAFGNAGTVEGEEVAPFGALYISKDNGIVWKDSGSFYLRMPVELKGADVSFASAADSNDYIWLVTGGEQAAVWKGIINRLGFK